MPFFSLSVPPHSRKTNPPSTPPNQPNFRQDRQVFRSALPLGSLKLCNDPFPESNKKSACATTFEAITNNHQSRSNIKNSVGRPIQGDQQGRSGYGELQPTGSALCLGLSFASGSLPLCKNATQMTLFSNALESFGFFDIAKIKM